MWFTITKDDLTSTKVEENKNLSKNTVNIFYFDLFYIHTHNQFSYFISCHLYKLSPFSNYFPVLFLPTLLGIFLLRYLSPYGSFWYSKMCLSCSFLITVLIFSASVLDYLVSGLSTNLGQQHSWRANERDWERAIGREEEVCFSQWIGIVCNECI